MSHESTDSFKRAYILGYYQTARFMSYDHRFLQDNSWHPRSEMITMLVQFKSRRDVGPGRTCSEAPSLHDLSEAKPRNHRWGDVMSTMSCNLLLIQQSLILKSDDQQQRCAHQRVCVLVYVVFTIWHLTLDL